MKENTKRVTEYLTEENYEYLEQQKSRKGLSYSDTVNTALNALRNKVIHNKAEELVKPTEEKMDQILYNQRYIMNTINGIYRTGNYTANLINGGIPITRINGDSVVKPNQSIKDLARKKALRDYSKLISQDYFREDFLEDYHEYDVDNTDDCYVDDNEAGTSDLEKMMKRSEDKHKKENVIHFR